MATPLGIHLELPVRFTGQHEDESEYTTLSLDTEKTVFLLVDCEFVNPPESPVGQVIRNTIAPTLDIVGSAGIKPVFLYGGSHNDRHSVNLELHGSRRRQERPSKPWPLPIPQWVPGVEPQEDEAVIVKCGQGGFGGTGLDHYLRTNGVENLLCVGFSFKSCLFYTMVGAFENNYRTVFLRDGTHPPGENEFRDTVDDELPEKGWVRLVLTRLIEDHLGYSSTCTELIQSCKDANGDS